MAVARPMAPVWNLQCVQLNEVDVECCRFFQQHFIGDYFQMYVRVRREPCFLLHPNMPSTLTAVNPPSIECDSGSYIIEYSWDDIRENGLSRIESKLSSNHIIPAEFIPSLAQNVIQYANELVQGCPPGFGYGYESPHFTWFKFVLDITVPELIDDQDFIRNIMWQSVTQMASELGDNQDDIRVPELYHNENHFMVPELYDNADHFMVSQLYDSVDYTLMWEPLELEPLEMTPTSIAIESLKKVKLEEGAAMESCSICLTELGDGARAVSSTPCKHVFHQDCLVQWLIKSPTCPLCRCAIPTLIDYT